MKIKRQTSLPKTPSPIPGLPVVLHVRVVTNCGGGPDKTILRSGSFGPPAGLQVAAVCIHPVGDSGIKTLQESAAALGCPFYAIPERGPVDFGTVRSLLQLCRRLRVAIWHAHDYKSNVLGLILRRFWPMKLVSTAHGWTGETRRMRLYERLDHYCLPRYDQVFAVSQPLAAQCRAVGVPQANLTYLPNGIVLADYVRRFQPAEARDLIGLDPKTLVIGMVGRLGPEKGVDRAIRLLSLLLPRFPNAQLHIIGDGPERQRLGELACSLAIQPAVKFWGWQAQARKFYEIMDMLLLTSHTEGLPNVVLEAMAMGVCVASTRVGDVPQLLDNGHYGQLLHQDAHRWPEEVGHLLAGTQLRAGMAHRARHRVESHYSFEKRAAAEIALYRRLLGVPGGVQLAAA